MRQIILISEDRVKTVSNLDNNVFGKWLLPATREAQDVQLQSIIGSTLYNQLLTLVDSGDIALPEYELYKDLLDNQIADFLVYQSLVNVIPLINVNMANMGTVISNDEHIQTLSQGNVDLVRGYYQNLADIYQKRLQDFLKCHREYFPELNECGCDNCGVKPNLNSNTNTSGIWLGGLRNPRKGFVSSECCGGSSKSSSGDCQEEYNKGYRDGERHQKSLLVSTAITKNGVYERENGYSSISVNVPDRYEEGFESGYTSGETHQKSLLVSTAFTENGDYSREDGWDNINVNVPDRYDDGYTDGYESGETHQKSLLIATAVTANGTYGRSNGYSSIEVNVPTGSTINNQTKDIIVRQNGYQNIGYDSGYTGLESVYLTVEVPEKSLTEESAWYGENGVYEILPQGADGMSKVTLEIDVPQEGYTQEDLDNAYQSGVTDGENQQKAKLVATAFTQNGTYTRTNGYSAVTVNVDTTIGYNKLIIDFSQSERVSGLTNNAIVTINGGEQGGTSNYTFTGSNIVVNLLPGLDYTITYGDVPNYDTPSSYSMTTKWDTQTTIYPIYTYQEPIVLSVTPDSNNLHYNAQTLSLSVSSNTSWVVTGSPEWCTLSTTAGTGNATITVMITENEGDERRSYIDFETLTGSTSVSVYIRQGVYSDKSAPLTFEIVSGGTIWWQADSDTSAPEASGAVGTVISYSLNGSDLVSVSATTGGTPIVVQAGDVLQFYGDNSGLGGSSAYAHFTTHTTTSYAGCYFKAYGNVFSLISSTGYSSITNISGLTKGFYCLFRDCRHISNHSTKNIALPATTLKKWCYQGMFSTCYELERAPELPAEVLLEGCYYYMFQNCSSLNYIKCLALREYGDAGALNNYPFTSWACNNWTTDVSSTGTLVKNSGLTYTSGVPERWTIIDA